MYLSEVHFYYKSVVIDQGSEFGLYGARAPMPKKTKLYTNISHNFDKTLKKGKYRFKKEYSDIC